MNDALAKDFTCFYHFGIRNVIQFFLIPSCWNLIADYLFVDLIAVETFLNKFDDLEFNMKDSFCCKFELFVNCDEVLTSSLTTINGSHFCHLQVYDLFRAVFFDDTQNFKKIIFDIFQSNKYETVDGKFRKIKKKHSFSTQEIDLFIKNFILYLRQKSFY